MTIRPIAIIDGETIVLPTALEVENASLRSEIKRLRLLLDDILNDRDTPVPSHQSWSDR